MDSTAALTLAAGAGGGGAAGIEQLRARWLGGLALATARGYAHDVAAWLEHCAAAGIDPAAASDRDLTGYLGAIAHLAPATRARRLAGIASFYRWLHDEGVVATVPSVPAGSRPHVRGRDDARLIGLDVDQAAALIIQADAWSDRMGAFVATLLSTGARLSEALTLVPAAIVPAGGGRHVTTIHGKGNRTRTVAVPPLALERLERIEPADPHAPYFVTRSGRAWGAREARDSLARLGRRAGVPLHPHLLRHSAGSIALAQGVDVERVREMLGHASLSTTQLYVRARHSIDASATYAVAAAIAPRH
ncbi:tyrosine-type recombinase/integrase (plasmid) [Brachybacterium huguangmaarense]|uniref:Tyrosine-type recombinase/integrase n=1 Tax=Brachybacterium huguangmaarense TaxID=1652028 RepID=A0ABY6G6L2_9MICO|nr:tyrosine-type recombinase/integrase [Brachybacterium huguangmaarense]UYG18313.1 tyrosine-type recombinase/integrase [Brachybacterium huguangmaarense]